jgi:phosphoglycolate phosphatase-like HAD superfamily hydrolase
MAGTTVDDVIDGVPLVLKSYDDAFRNFGVAVPMTVLNAQRGRDKRVVINELGGSEADDIYEYFVNQLLTNISSLHEIKGTSELFSFFHNHSVSVGICSGFPATVTKTIVDHLGWMDQGLIDYWTCSEMVGKSRPDPTMIRSIMTHFRIHDPLKVIKVDDTRKGLEAGIRAGVITLGVLTGTQVFEHLQAVKPRYILNSIAELPSYLIANNLLI